MATDTTTSVDADAFATGDGQTDDTVALRAAIATGKHVRFSRGKTYLISGGLRLGVGQIIYGNGATLKRRQQAKTTTSTAVTAGQTKQLDVADPSALAVGMDIALEASSTTWQKNNRRITAINGSTITLNDVLEINAPSGGTVWGSYEAVTLLDDCRVYDLRLNGNRSAWSWYRWQNTRELYVGGARAIVSGCYLTDTPGEGIYLEADFITVTDTTLLNTNGNGVHLGSSNRTVIDRVRVVNANLDTSVGHADGCIVLSNQIAHLTVSNCYCENGISGITSWDSNDNSDLTIVGNTIKSCTQTAMEGLCPVNLAPGRILIANNRIYDSVALFVSGTESATTVFPNRFVIDGNFLQNTRLEIRRARYINVTGNIFDSSADKQNDTIRIWDSKFVLIRGNNLIGGANGIAVFRSETVLLDGNSCSGQSNAGIVFTSAGLNTCQAVGNQLIGDAAASATYRGVDLNAGGVARGNLIQLTQGDSGVYAGTRSIVKDNIVRSGSATYSIRAAPGSTSVLIKDNEVTAPVSNGGDSTNVVTGTTVIA